MVLEAVERLGTNPDLKARGGTGVSWEKKEVEKLSKWRIKVQQQMGWQATLLHLHRHWFAYIQLTVHSLCAPVSHIFYSEEEL